MPIPLKIVKAHMHAFYAVRQDLSGSGEDARRRGLTPMKNDVFLPQTIDFRVSIPNLEENVVVILSIG